MEKNKEKYIESYGHKLISNRKYTTFICRRKPTKAWIVTTISADMHKQHFYSAPVQLHDYSLLINIPSAVRRFKQI